MVRLVDVELVAVAHAISHRLFPYNSFLFFRANIEDAQRIKDILNMYGRNSGKTVIFRSRVFSLAPTCVKIHRMIFLVSLECGMISQ